MYRNIKVAVFYHCAHIGTWESVDKEIMASLNASGLLEHADFVRNDCDGVLFEFPTIVNALARMVKKHYSRPAQVICVTDDPTGIDPDIKIVPDDKDFADIPSPHGGMSPTCYRRLRMFRPDAEKWFGPRFVSTDLDVVLTADVTHLWDRLEDITLYRDPLYPNQYNGSMIVMNAGSRPEVWTLFDPARSPRTAQALGYRGSDQAWISACLPGEIALGPSDGIYSYRKDIEPAGGKLPANARIVVFHVKSDPWSPEAQRLPWVREHWGTIKETT